MQVIHVVYPKPYTAIFCENGLWINMDKPYPAIPQVDDLRFISHGFPVQWMVPMRFKLRSPNPAATSKRRTCSGLGSPVMVEGMLHWEWSSPILDWYICVFYIYNTHIIYTYHAYIPHVKYIYVERERGVLCAYICVHIYIYSWHA